MAKKKVLVTATRTYYKTGVIEIEVDEDATMRDISDLVAFDTEIDNRIEDAIANASLSADETSYEYQEK
jgi:hypothetical protein